LLLAFGFGLSAGPSGVFYAQPGRSTEVRLELGLPPNFALQKRSEFWLENPFAQGKMLGARVTGHDWPPDPEHYLQSFGPLVWTLRIPAGAAKAEYPLRFSVTVYACDQRLGLCQKHTLKATGRLVVGQEGQSRAVRLELPAASGF
jgi:hypothetical protein